MRIVLMLALVACGSSSKSSTMSSGATGSVDEVVGAAVAEVSRLNADYTCACSGEGSKADFCKHQIVVHPPEDNSLDGQSPPYILHKDRAKPLLAYTETCWGKLAEWEDARGLACLGQEKKAGPKPSCGRAPSFLAAGIDAWWKSPNACGPKQKIATKPNPMKQGALLGAWCEEPNEYGTPYAKGRITEWYVNGNVASDRDDNRRTDWYPHGQKSAEGKTGAQPPPSDGGFQDSAPVHWVHYWPNGKVSEQGDRINGEMKGPWEGFRTDGTKQYTANFVDYGDKVTWLDQNGQPEPEEKHAPLNVPSPGGP